MVVVAFGVANSHAELMLVTSVVYGCWTSDLMQQGEVVVACEEADDTWAWGLKVEKEGRRPVTTVRDLGYECLEGPDTLHSVRRRRPGFWLPLVRGRYWQLIPILRALPDRQW